MRPLRVHSKTTSTSTQPSVYQVRHQGREQVPEAAYGFPGASLALTAGQVYFLPYLAFLTAHGAFPAARSPDRVSWHDFHASRLPYLSINMHFHREICKPVSSWGRTTVCSRIRRLSLKPAPDPNSCNKQARIAKLIPPHPGKDRPPNSRASAF